MRILLVLIAILLTACSNGISKDLENALAFGTIRDLNDLNPEVGKDLYIRLFESPIYEANCFKETHGVCRYKYFLSVSTFDEYPETNLYELDNTGEIIEVKWLNEEKVDHAELSLVFNRYTGEALSNNPDLNNRSWNVLIKANPDKFAEQKRPDQE
jgi:hypothetical protein